MGSLTPSTLIWSNMSFVTKTKKGILAFLNQPISFLFFILDKLYDEIFLPLVGRIWRFEGILRGGVIGSGLFFGRPILKFFPGSKVWEFIWSVQNSDSYPKGIYICWSRCWSKWYFNCIAKRFNFYREAYDSRS